MFVFRVGPRLDLTPSMLSLRASRMPSPRFLLLSPRDAFNPSFRFHALDHGLPPNVPLTTQRCHQCGQLLALTQSSETALTTWKLGTLCARRAQVWFCWAMMGWRITSCFCGKHGQLTGHRDSNLQRTCHAFHIANSSSRATHQQIPCSAF